MRILPLKASDDMILSAVREWVALLAEENYNDAVTFLSQERTLPEAVWTPQRLEAAIYAYGRMRGEGAEKTFRITPLELAASGELAPRHDVNRDEIDSPEGYVWFDLPVDGKWSDLTALLNFYPMDDGIVFDLEDIHVM